MVSANLAMSLAQAGQRVLLIDADMRRPKTHEFFGVAQEPGLSNVLVGDAKASEAVKTDADAEPVADGRRASIRPTRRSFSARSGSRTS